MKGFPTAGNVGVWTLLLFVCGCGGDETSTEPTLPNILLVRPDGSGDCATIQEAIDTAESLDVVELTDGVFCGDGNRDIDFRGKAITLRSCSGDPETCIIRCGGSEDELHRGFIFRSGEGADCAVAGVTIRGGYIAGEEGHELGGGVFCEASSPRLSNCVLERNIAWNGGGMACMYGAAPVLTDCIFSENVALNIGGGIFCFSSDLVLDRCCFYADSAWNHGGGVECYSCSPELVDCIFRDNWAWRWGGALGCQLASPTGTGCTFVGNGTFQYPATISARSSSEAVLVRSIIAFGTWISIDCDDGSSASLRCCNVFGNPGGDWGGCIWDQLGVDGNISLDPQFCDLDAGDLRLRSGSPCVPNGEDGCGLVGALPVGCE